MSSHDAPIAPHRAKGGTDQHLRHWSFGLALVAGALALVLLILGWLGDVDRLTRIQPGFPAMVPATAACLSGLTAALLLVLRKSPPRAAQIACALATLIGLYAALHLVTDIGSGSLGLFDRPFWQKVGGMAPATAVGLMCAAIGTLSLAWPAPRRDAFRHRLCRITASLGLIIAVVAIDGYLFDPQMLRAVGFFRAMSLPTALCLAALFLALLLANANDGWITPLFTHGPGGRMARRALPLVLILPLSIHLLPLPLIEQATALSHFQIGCLTIALALLGALLVLRSAARRTESHPPLVKEAPQLRQILDGIDTAVFALDSGGEIRMSNQRAAQLVDAAQAPSPADWLYNTPFHTLNDDNHRILRPAERPAAQLMAKGHLAPIDLGSYAPDGTVQMFRFAAPRRSAPDAGTLLVLSVSELTADQRPQLMPAPNAHSDRHPHLPEALSHDLRNIIGAIRLSADAGLLGDDPRAARRYFNAIKTASTRGLNLTDISPPSTEPTTTTARAKDSFPAFDLTVALCEIVERARDLIPAPLLIESELPPLSLWIRCNPAALNSALLNLMINARNNMLAAGQSEGSILVFVEDRPGTLCITVVDTGPGMNPQDLATATKPLLSTGAIKEGPDLAATVAFAQDSGGQFELTSHAGRGTTARLLLPAVPPPLRTPASSPHRLSDTTSNLPPPRTRPMSSTLSHIGISLSGLRVLVVEDDPLYGDILAESLRILGAEIEMCQNADAVEALLTTATANRGTATVARSGALFDVLVTDVNLPGQRDGYAVADLVRRHQPGIGVVFMSGFGAPDPDSDPASVGTFLRKPVSVADMASAIAASAADKTKTKIGQDATD